MAVDWYLRIADKEVGPLSAQQLRTMAGKGQIGPEDFVRPGDEGGWVPANRVKGLLAATASDGSGSSASIPVAKLLKPADEKSSKVKTPSTTTPVRKKKREAKVAKAIEEPAAESSLPPVVAQSSVPVPPPPPTSAGPVAGLQVVGEAVTVPPVVAGPPPVVLGPPPVVAGVPAVVLEPEAEAAITPPGRQSPGIELPFDVTPTSSSGAHARVVVDEASTSGLGNLLAALRKLKSQVDYTIVAVAVVVVMAAGLFIYAWMSSGDSTSGKSGTATVVATAEKPAKDAADERESAPVEVKKAPEKKVEPTVDLMGLVLGKDGRPVGPSKAKENAAPAKSPETKPEKAEIAAKDKWFDASKEPAVGKNVSVLVKSARVGKFIRGAASALGQGLKLTLQITNHLKDRQLKLEALTRVERDSLLVDNFDHAYALKEIGFRSEDSPDLKTIPSINPEESVDVDLIFEKPFKTAEYLRLKLPGTIFNEPDAIRIEISKDMIQTAGGNWDENPAPADQGQVHPNKRASAPLDPPGAAEKDPPAGDATAGPDASSPADADPAPRGQPRGGRNAQVAQAHGRRPAVIEPRISDFDTDPAMAELYGKRSAKRTPDRNGSRDVD
jgi:hypothetical protein